MRRGPITSQADDDFELWDYSPDELEHALKAARADPEAWWIWLGRMSNPVQRGRRAPATRLWMLWELAGTLNVTAAWMRGAVTAKALGATCPWRHIPRGDCEAQLS